MEGVRLALSARAGFAGLLGWWPGWRYKELKIVNS